MILPMFYFSFYNSGSGTALYESWLIMSYNGIFTSLPIIVLGVMDHDLNVDYSLKYAQLYSRGFNNYEFNAKIFLS